MKIKLGLLMIAVLAISAACTCNFGTYGSGETYGYVTTVEDNGSWGAVHIRASYASSQSNCYEVDPKNTALFSSLTQAVQEEARIKATFTKTRKLSLFGGQTCYSTSLGQIVTMEFINDP